MIFIDILKYIHTRPTQQIRSFYFGPFEVIAYGLLLHSMIAFTLLEAFVLSTEYARFVQRNRYRKAV